MATRSNREVEKPNLLFQQLTAALEEARTVLRQAQGTQIPTAALEAKLSAARAVTSRLQRMMAQLESRLDEAEMQAAEQRVKRADATARRDRAERQLSQIQQSTLWQASKPLWKLALRPSRGARSPAFQDDLAFGVDAPAQWQDLGEIILIRGWCLSKSGREIAGVRAKIGKKGRLGRYGIARPDVVSALNDRNRSERCGFTIEVPVPAGASVLRLEAIVQGGDWEMFFETEMRSTRSPLPEGKSAPARAPVEIPEVALPVMRDVSARQAATILRPLLCQHHERAGNGRPFFSLITPTYNSEPRWLVEAARSVLEQSFVNWEWCLVDDGSTDRETRELLEEMQKASPRLRVQFNPNGGISAATNAGLDLARGDFVCFMDHDDLLAPSAFAEMHKKIEEGFDAVYSDEDKLEDLTGQLTEPFFKPEWSPEYLRGAMYIGHLLCVRKELAHAVRFDSDFDGVQDFEFMLRVGEVTSAVGHIPRILYHWRKTPGSIAEHGNAKPQIDALQERAVNAHLQRLGLPARAETKGVHRLRSTPAPCAKYPRVSIIIPSKDSPALLGRCLESLFELTSYPNFEVVVVDNATTDPEALRLLKKFPVRVLEMPGRFNFSRANNRGVQKATGDLLVFLNNDTEIIERDWLQHLHYHTSQPDVGAAGSLLIYGNHTVQHAGVVLGMRGTADHIMRRFPKEVDGYAGSLSCAREVTAVTAACMMMRKDLFCEIGGFNEHYFTAYQDVDLCLNLRERGLRIVYTPEAVVVHHESLSRKDYYDMVDRMLLLDQWEAVIERGDPYYNPNLNLERGDYSPAIVA